jgi:plastocyanin
MHLIVLLLASIWFAEPSRPPVSQTIRMEQNRFTPRDIRARAGDTLKFVNGVGGPHNIQFEKDSIAPDAAKLIDKALGKNRMFFLATVPIILVGETFNIVVPDIPAGEYPLFCNPHYAQMRGKLVVEP